MPAKDLGAKYVCFKCATKFYDLRKPDPVCPKCGADQRDSPALKAPSEGKRTRAAPKVLVPVVEPEEAELPEPEEEAEDELADEEEVVATDDDDV